MTADLPRSVFTLLGASATLTIPPQSKSWTVSFITGTGTLGGVAVPAGFSDSDAGSAIAIIVTTDSASSAYVRYSL